MTVPILIAAVAPPTITTGIFGVLWLRALRGKAKAEADRDRYWDLVNVAAPFVAASTPATRLYGEHSARNLHGGNR